MTFDVATIVSYLSEFTTPEPRDVTATATLVGVGLGVKPPRFLQAGDEMPLGISGPGEQRQRVVSF